MAIIVVSTAVFGRFFCSWGCHILALEDASAWILGRLGIRPKPFRARLLLLVPPAAAAYMFVWPQAERWLEGRAWPGLRLATDADGWASFVTESYWRSMPGPWISLATLLVCGFVVVYLLGSRSFCTYACPYGAIFSLADRVAPARIVARGDCTECGKCTAACQTHIRVHEELVQFGRVVNPSCLKAMDCVDACPTGNVVVGFAKPSGFLSWRKLGRFGVPYDLTWGEEFLAAAVWVAGLAIYRGLYEALPFLLTLALCGVLGFVAVLGLRLLRAAHVRLAPFQLKIHGRLTAAGATFAGGAVLVAGLTVHSGFIRFHEVAGQRAFDAAAAAEARGEPPGDAASRSRAHLAAAERWGLVRPAGLDRRLAALHLFAGDAAAAEPYARRVVGRDPDDGPWRIRMAAILLTRGAVDEAVIHLEAAKGSPDRRTRGAAHGMLAEVRMAQGDEAAASREMEAALALGLDSPL
jgi:polyferredoxin